MASPAQEFACVI